MLDQKLGLLREKGFYDIEVINGGSFKGKYEGDLYQIRYDNNYFLTLNNMGWGCLK